MSKSSLIFSALFATLILLLFILSQNTLFVKVNERDDADLPKNEKIPIDYALNSLNTEKEEPKKSLSKFTSDDFQAGMSILIYGHPNMHEAKELFEELRQLGVNSVSINFPFYQKDWQANEVTTSQIHTPTILELEDVIVEAHHAGLSVTLRPIMDEQVFIPSGLWRGQIKPKDPHVWFDSYEALLLTYAKLAQSTNAKSLNIGTELNSMQNKYPERWIELIDNIRQTYKGELLYSFNWDTVHEISSIEFVKYLDFVGIDAYFPLNLPDNASTEMLEKEWIRQLNQFKDMLPEKPIIVTEAGIIPIAGAYRTPYVWGLPNRRFDPEAQANYYEATYEVWKPLSQGIYWWVITLGQDPSEISFTPLGLPTEKVIKKQYLKPFTNEEE